MAENTEYLWKICDFPLDDFRYIFIHRHMLAGGCWKEQNCRVQRKFPAEMAYLFDALDDDLLPFAIVNCRIADLACLRREEMRFFAENLPRHLCKCGDIRFYHVSILRDRKDFRIGFTSH